MRPEARKRNNVTLRLRDRLRAALQAEADANGRSLSEEMETRLERSLRDDRVVALLEEISGRLG